jgi:hypothetical protein
MSEWSRIVKGGTKWRAERPLTSLWNELDFGAEGIQKNKNPYQVAKVGHQGASTSSVIRDGEVYLRRK